MNQLQLPVHPPEQKSILLTLPTPSVRPTLLDRFELRVALWLLMRNARRHGSAISHEEQHRRHRNNTLRTRREHDALRAHGSLSVRS